MSKKMLQAAAGNAGGGSLYAEDVFSTYLYTGTGSSLPIVNGIDLADSGGLVWTKRRTSANSNWFLDSERGGTQIIRSNTTEGQFTSAGLEITSFNSDGYTLGTAADINSTSQDDASWTFRKAEKFFDVVTYTGTGDTAPGQTVAHNLGSTPGFMIIKRTDSTSDWSCYHNGLTSSDYYLKLNATTAETEDGTVFPSAPTDSNFYVRADRVNVSGGTFVAYLFASDAGGFGDDGSENIIKCGSYTGNGSTDGPTIDCGFEPQWLLIRHITDAGNWLLMDAMRGMPVGDEATVLLPSASGAEFSFANLWGVDLQATGFKVNVSQGQINQSGGTYIYIAIRRPMKTPESGTEVFAVDDRAAATPAFVSDFPVDLYWTRAKTGGNFFDYARLRGDKYLQHDGTNADTDGAAFFDSNTGVGSSGSASTNNLAWMFKRATGFMDVVAYTSTNSAINHNLGVSPELVIYKNRTIGPWYTMVATDGFGELNSSGAWGGTGNGSGLGPNLTNATATTIKGAAFLSGSGVPMVTYLFATLAGVSKVGSYTGTGSNVDVGCGFSAGARFILIKRTDSTGDWYVYDSFRGIVSGNDPYLLLNTGTGEVTNTDYIDPLSSGFTVTSSAPAALNASGGSYIFLAIA